MLEPFPPDRPARQVGPYRLLGRLGSGGMGEVHLACHATALTADPARMVAVKTIRGDLELDSRFRRRFAREYAAARAVRSPYTAALVDGRADDEDPWLATTYVPGPSLAEAVGRRGPLDEPAVRALGAALADALRGVHAAGLLHRDLKPDNILLSADGPRLIDFGVARAFDASALTRAGTPVGTKSFMAPEQLAGRQSLTAATDVFSLGISLYFAATGRNPFAFIREAREKDDRIAELLTDVPAGLRPVLTRCLHIRPAGRATPEWIAEQWAVPAGAFPWAPGVRALIAGDEEAARRCGAALMAPLTTADRNAPVPHSPTLQGNAIRPASAQRKPRQALRAALRMLSVTAALLVVSADEPEKPTPKKHAAALPAHLAPYTGEGRPRDFGKGAVSRLHRPAYWSPWTGRAQTRTGPCALDGTVLLCASKGGALTALDANYGHTLWSHRGDTSAAGATAANLGVVAGVAYVNGPRGTDGYRVRDGVRVAHHDPPPGRYTMGGAETLDGVMYSVYAGPFNGDGTGLLTARKLDSGDEGRGGGGRELWRIPVPGGPQQPLVAGGRVYVPRLLEGLVSYDARTGGDRVDSDGVSCEWGQVRDGRLVCVGADERGGVHILDARTLKRRSLIGRGRHMRSSPALGPGGLLAIGDGKTVSLHNLATGRTLWSESVEYLDGNPGPLYFADDRLILVNGAEIMKFAVSSGEALTAQYPGPKDWETDELLENGECLAVGGILYVTFSDGTVVSGYL
ncbi:protein kinase [Streptomyces sp. CA-278952]|uniref:serine/threonine-protein kinase n=1 Tax=Streptomyces sp. CA-278952 TaxID=2980556 RepID=UPI002367EDEA|nr:serine/threonine-protein kinase [Streptomyces sp. CA-278952]WDG26870.1 protein kinase [Streptomyces sp. CA-278952]